MSTTKTVNEITTTSVIWNGQHLGKTHSTLGMSYIPTPKMLPVGFQGLVNVFVLDTETRDLTAKHNPYTPLHFIGLVHAASQLYFTLTLEQFIEFEKTFDLLFVGHNITFDVSVLRVRGAKVERYFDTALAAAIWSGGSSDNFKLEALGETLGFPKSDLRQALIKSGKLDPKAYKGAEYYDKSDEMLDYLYHDLNATLAVFFHYLEHYASDNLAWRYLINVEIPYIELILEMQAGTIIDTSKLDEIQVALGHDLSAAWQALQDVLASTGQFIQFDGETWLPDPTKGGTVDKESKVKGEMTYPRCRLRPYAPSNVQDNIYILSKAYGWTGVDKTKAGAVKLDKHILEKLAAKGNTFAEVLLEYRLLYKLSSTFVDGIKSATDPITSVLHPEYCNICTRTHRLSSMSPNLQNLPARSKTAAKVRELFTVPDGYALAVADLDRIEAVLLGWWLLQIEQPDDRLAQVFLDGVDLHQTNADSWGISRFLAKTVLYLLMYGGGALRLSIAAGVSLEEAEEVFKSVDEGMPAIKLLKEWLIAEALKNKGIIHDPLGNRYSIPELLSDKPWERAKGERLVFSYVNQGFAGSLFKELQLRLRDRVKSRGLRAKQLLQVHDEVIYGVKVEDLAEFLELGTDTLTTYDILTTEGYPAIPVSGTFNTGKTWLEAK